ncbi:Uncharacterised protein [Streptococcus pneumoniae]|nr:Uncharacterised protein [Streptococcus pneumoniae]
MNTIEKVKQWFIDREIKDRKGRWIDGSFVKHE